MASAVFDTVAWGNDGFPGFSAEPVVAACSIDDSGRAGLGVDPRFVAPGAGEDYRLQGNSPAIDACADGMPVEMDEIVRPFASLYDIGAYEDSRGLTFVYLPLVVRNK